jgi:putative ABC transport system substrate-binding protein
MRLSTVRLMTTLALTLLMMPLASDAEQPAKLYRIGILGATSAAAYAPFISAFREGLHDLGHVEGKDIVIDSRWAEGRYDRLPDLAAELVRLQVDLIVTHGPVASRAAKEATPTIPIVMAVVGDAVASELVASLARPGGNLTGSSFLLPELTVKRVEFLKEAMPGVTRVAVLVNPANPVFPLLLNAMAPTAQSLGMELRAIEVRATNELEQAFASIAQWPAHALAVTEDAVFLTHAKRLAELAAARRVPTIGFTAYTEAGGLMSYGPNLPALWRRAAYYVDRIMKGATPADLPVEQPMKLDLVINLKTAQALGITIPPSLLLLADEVIQ